jgi:hypothetical protein
MKAEPSEDAQKVWHHLYFKFVCLNAGRQAQYDNILISVVRLSGVEA